MTIEFASIAVSNFDWGNYETVQGSADRIPQALRSLLDASLAQADSYYWEIENQVVVQGQLFSAAEPTLQVLVASLLDPRPKHTKIDVLELIFQIVAGSVSEASDTEYKKLQTRIHSRAVDALWIFYGELDGEHAAAALEILELIDPGRMSRVSAR